MKGSTAIIAAELISWHLIIIGIPLINSLTNKTHTGLPSNGVVLLGSMYCFMILYIYNQWLWLRRDEEDGGTCDDPPRTGSPE